MKRLQHPRHGFAFAHNAVEEAAMRSNGWADESVEPDEAQQDNDQKTTADAQVTDGSVPRRPGRPRKTEA